MKKAKESPQQSLELGAKPVSDVPVKTKKPMKDWTLIDVMRASGFLRRRMYSKMIAYEIEQRKKKAQETILPVS